MSNRISKTHRGVLAGVMLFACAAYVGPAQAGGYPIVSRTHSTCLGAMSRNTSGSANTNTCSTSDGQRFQFKTQEGFARMIWGGYEYWYTQIVFDHSSMCLAVTPGYISPGTRVEQQQCDQTGRQLWNLLPINDTYFEVVHAGTGQCLTLKDTPGCPPGGSICMEDMDQVEVDLCRGRHEQHWNIARVQRIVAAHSNKCLDVEGRGTDAEDNVIQNHCQDQANQLWFRRPDLLLDKSPTHWVNLRSGLCLDAYNYQGRTNVDQYYCDNYTSQLWEQQYADFGTYFFKPDMGGTGYCMDVKGRSKDNGANVQRYRCHDGSNQQWKVMLEGD